jgi:hypothetical protein
MLSHCANPDHLREPHSLRDGKIYQFVVSPKRCSKSMILICVNQSEVKNLGEGRTPIHPKLNPVTVWHDPKERAL